ncbi:MAG: hypothetical protein E6K69_02455 [Nitrospirae bacterium]|nr:MAG: hypothetical protein E6K69_02455 [Nitrospirota bacterium]
MVTLFLLSLISLILVAAGAAIMAMPSWWSGWVRRALVDPLRRFLLTQGMILGGLILILGASTHRGHWLWVTVGLLGVGKALVLLGAPDSLCHRMLNLWERSPLWAHRLSGLMLVVLGTFLTIDTLRVSP